MNATETSEVLDVIAAHYWQQVRKDDREKALMVATWSEVFADVPRDPHVRLALVAWFREHQWAPQASELRRLALQLGGPTPIDLARAEVQRRVDDSRRAEWDALRARVGYEAAWEEEPALEARVDAFRERTRQELGLPLIDRPEPTTGSSSRLPDGRLRVL